MEADLETGEVVIPDNVNLEVVMGDEPGKVFPITAKTMTIGRSEVCDIRLADQYVSKKHCQVVFRQDHFTVIDLQSLNKTRVNDRMFIQKNLHDNDIIRIGKTEFRFRWAGPAMAAGDEDDIPVPEGEQGPDGDSALKL